MIYAIDMHDVLARTDAAAALRFAAIGAVVGATAVPLLVYLSIKTNYKKMGTIYAGLPQGTPFYRVFAMAGAATFAIVVGSQPFLDAAGKDEVWIRGALIPVMLVVVGIPLWRALRRLRQGPPPT